MKSKNHQLRSLNLVSAILALLIQIVYFFILLGQDPIFFLIIVPIMAYSIFNIVYASMKTEKRTQIVSGCGYYAILVPGILMIIPAIYPGIYVIVFLFILGFDDLSNWLPILLIFNQVYQIISFIVLASKDKK